MEHKWTWFLFIDIKSKGNLGIMKPHTKTRSWGGTVSIAWELVIASVRNFCPI